MPLYDYKCHKCGKVFEVRQSFSDELLKTHDDCGGDLERLISAPALQFKGSGWYITDYARGGNSATSGKSSNSEGGGKNESKSDSSSGSSSGSSAAASSSSSSSSSGSGSSGDSK